MFTNLTLFCGVDLIFSIIHVKTIDDLPKIPSLLKERNQDLDCGLILSPTLVPGHQPSCFHHIPYKNQQEPISVCWHQDTRKGFSLESFVNK